MDYTKAIFLTEKDINKAELIKVLESLKNEINKTEDRKILEEIIHDFETNDFSLLSPQEIQFLNTYKKNIWHNYLIFRYKFQNYPKRNIASDYPLYLCIEPVSACNLRCVMCYQIDESFSSNPQFMGNMELDLFKKIIDEAQNGEIHAVTLASRGEPTLHPQIGEMLEYCSGKFFELKINTNATRLNDKLIHQILESEFSDVVFSVDSYTKESYEKIRVKAVFDEVLNNIKKFKKIKETEYPNSKCATRVSGVKVNPDQDPNIFKKFWEKYVDHVVMVEMEPWWDTYQNSTELGGKGTCDYLWQRMNIWYDGLCNPCDVDYKSNLSVGSLKNNTIHELWTGEKYEKIRQLHITKNRQNCFPCDRCPR